LKELWPAEQPGMKVDRMVSFVDMPKTWLSITGSPVPETMQGAVFLGKKAEPENKLHFAFRGRMDERNENARAVCDKQFLYIRNYMPYVPWMQHLNTLWRMEASQAWSRHVESGNATEVQARFFKPKGWTEELYDMEKDPDNVDNLIDNPEYARIIAKMRGGLRDWQEQVYDAGLLPESEMVKLAEDNSTTIYEAVRNPKLYNLPALLDAADLALEKNPGNLPALGKLLKGPDTGLRYWGIVGCFLLNDQQAGFQCLEDPSHEVRAMAAWLLIRTGEKDKGLQCLENLLKQESYATLKVLNILDWLDEDAKPLLPTIEAMKCGSYEQRMQMKLLVKYGLRSPDALDKKKMKQEQEIRKKKTAD
jgi:hypothetical protein